MTFPEFENEITQFVLSVFHVKRGTAHCRRPTDVFNRADQRTMAGAWHDRYDSSPADRCGDCKVYGLNRQNVRVIVKELETAGMVRLAENPNHQRANLVLATAKGRRCNASAKALQGPFVDGLSKGLETKRISDAVDLLQTILRRLRNQNEQP